MEASSCSSGRLENPGAEFVNEAGSAFSALKDAAFAEQASSIITEARFRIGIRFIELVQLGFRGCASRRLRGTALGCGRRSGLVARLSCQV